MKFICSAVFRQPLPAERSIIATPIALIRKQTGGRALRPLPAAVRGLSAVSVDGRHILLAGGYTDSGFSAAAYLYDIEDGPVQGRHFPTLARDGNGVAGTRPNGLGRWRRR